ncbi:MAG: cytochrome c biogenesis protein CcdA [Candidatus Saccharimonadales bacterium]
MGLFLLSFLAGILTVLAPCILPLLPIVLGGSLSSDSETGAKSTPRIRVLVIIGSLAISIIVFSLLLKATTALLGIPQELWQIISGGIITIFGLFMLFPALWVKLISRTGLYGSSNQALGRGYLQSDLKGGMVMGLALGPVFNSCSPTYALIVATILPVSFLEGLIYLVAYTIGLCLMLLLITLLGTKFVTKLGWLSDPQGWFHRIVAGLFILVGLFIIFGVDKDIQTYVLDKGWYDPVSGLEERLRR